MDGAERRHRQAIRWSGKEPRDLVLEPSNPEVCGAQEFWPEAVLSAFERTFETATQGALLLHREMIDIAQRNVNASFGFLRRLTGVKNLGEMLDLQVTCWRNQSAALIGQSEELRAMATKAAADMTGPFDARVRSSIHDMRKVVKSA